MPKDESGVELVAGDGRFLGIIDPVEPADDDEGPDLLISGASCTAMSRFSLFDALEAKEGIEEVEGLFEADDSVEVERDGVDVDGLEEEPTLENSAGRCRACTSVIKRACLA